MPSILDLMDRPKVPWEGGRGRVEVPIEERLQRNSEAQDDGCIVWTGSTTNAGYGALMFNRKGYKIVQLSAHRVAYELANGRIPEGLVIDHLCRNRRCINVAHMEAVTQRENVLRSPIAPGALNAAKTHCAKGHEYSPENTYVYQSGPPRSKTARICRICRAAYRRKLYAAQKGAKS